MWRTAAVVLMIFGIIAALFFGLCALGMLAVGMGHGGPWSDGEWTAEDAEFLVWFLLPFLLFLASLILPAWNLFRLRREDDAYWRDIRRRLQGKDREIAGPRQEPSGESPDRRSRDQ